MELSRTILIVDDDEGIRNALSELLREEGLVVDTAGNGREALDWLVDNGRTCCLVLLDLMMPVMDGSAFLHAKQGDPALATIPVVVITASGRLQDDLSRWRDVKQCIEKPIALPELFALIETCA